MLAALWQVARGGEGRCLNVSMTHAMHAHNVMAHIALANDDHASTHADLLNGGVPCYACIARRTTGSSPWARWN